MNLPYLKKVDSSIVFEGEYMEIYLPKTSFEKKISYLKGENIETLGIFNFLVYKDGNRDPKKAEKRSLTLPFKIQFQFNSFYDTKISLIPGREPEDYRVFTLEKGNLFCVQTDFAKSSANTKELIFMIHGGNLPSSVPYDKVLDCYVGTALLNGVDLKIPMLIYELILAELCRYKEDINTPFRKAINENNKLSHNDYKTISIKKLPSLNSTFASITFEDINNAVITSINKTKNNEDEKPSPIEKVLKY